MLCVLARQPALLYLVPCTLGVFCAASHREGTLAMMWSGPPSLNNGLKSGQVGGGWG